MIRSIVLALLVTVSIASAARVAHAQEDAPLAHRPRISAAWDQPARRRSDARVAHHADQGLVIAGTLTLSFAWALNAVGAFPASVGLDFLDSFDASYYWPSLIPIVGPLVWGAQALGTGDGLAATFAAFAFVDGAVQIAGLAMLIAGLVGVDEPVATLGADVRIAPVVGGDRAGLAIDGRF